MMSAPPFRTRFILPFFSSAYKKTLFICDGLIFGGQLVFAADDKIIAPVAVAAGAAADQLPMELSNSKEIGIAHQRQHMKKAVLSGKFRVWTLCEMITGGMTLSVIGLIDVDESVRISPDVLPVPISRFAEYLVDQPHIKRPVQIEHFPQLCKRPHEQLVHEWLQLSDRRLIGQGRNQRKYQQSPIYRPGMTVLLATVIREIPQIGDTKLNLNLYKATNL